MLAFHTIRCLLSLCKCALACAARHYLPVPTVPLLPLQGLPKSAKYDPKNRNQASGTGPAIMIDEY